MEVDTKTIATIWNYINAFDRSQNPSYMITAWAMFKSILETAEIPKFETEAWEFQPIYSFGHLREFYAKATRVTNDNIIEFSARWIGNLMRYSSMWVFQLAKVTLVKLLVVMGYIVAPNEMGDFDFDLSE